MDINKEIKKLAISAGFDLVESRGSWNGYELFNAGTKEDCDVGLPQFILASNKEVRWATVNEAKQIMATRF